MFSMLWWNVDCILVNFVFKNCNLYRASDKYNEILHKYIEYAYLTFVHLFTSVDKEPLKAKILKSFGSCAVLQHY